MSITNSKTHYGILSIVLHWVMASLIIGLFILGQYMVDLDYYDPWYQAAPWWHKSLGMSVFVLLLIRLLWRWKNVRPEALPSYKSWEIKTAKIVHILFYIAILLACMSGYFISSAKGVSIVFFGWFDIPAIIKLNENQAAFMADIHELMTQILAILFFVHVTAALKHHFINKDATLVRMLKTPNEERKIK